MAVMDQNGRLFGKINIIDFVLGAVVLLSVAGVFLVQSGTLVTSGQVVEGESDILVTVQIPNLKSLDKKLFVAGEKTAITIRNQPRGEVIIKNVTVHAPKITFLGANGKSVSIDDVAQENAMDYQLVLKDHAKVTKDGYVAEGVKVKIGLPIELEGMKYRVFGKIVDVNAAKS